MAAWGLDADDLKAVVGTVKRAPAYRAICRELQVRRPRDVWIEDGMGFVHFDGGGAGPVPAWFVFAVDVGAREVVAAKRLEPDDKGHEIRIMEIHAASVPA